MAIPLILVICVFIFFMLTSAFFLIAIAIGFRD